jgi:hypothetical protein
VCHWFDPGWYHLKERSPVLQGFFFLSITKSLNFNYLPEDDCFFRSATSSQEMLSESQETSLWTPKIRLLPSIKHYAAVSSLFGRLNILYEIAV